MIPNPLIQSIKNSVNFHPFFLLEEHTRNPKKISKIFREILKNKKDTTTMELKEIAVPLEEEP